MATKKKVLLADGALLFIAVSWGYTFILAKDLLEELSPLYFSGSRFLISGLILAVWQWKSLRKISPFYWKAGSIAGILLCAAFTTQTFGIGLTTPGKAGVITGTAVVIVPLLYFVWSRTPIQKGPIIGSVLAFVGLALFSWDGQWQGINFGDFLVLLCAISFALHLVYVDRTYDKENSLNPLLFAMIQFLVVGVIDLVLAILFEPVPSQLSAYGWYAYLFELLIGTLLGFGIQLVAQRYVPPIHVSLILSTESIAAFGFSWLIWGEPLTMHVVFGVILVVAGIFLTEIAYSVQPNKVETGA